MSNFFLKENDFYKRNIAPIEQYVNQASIFLSKSTGKSIEECKVHVLAEIKKPNSGAINPPITFYERQENGDRERKSIGLREYIGSIISEGEIVAPTLTTYLTPDKKESVLVKFTAMNKKNRSVAKKSMLDAKGRGDNEKAFAMNKLQDCMKTYNNSLSGTFNSDGSVLKNPSAHSTLTSTIRTVTSIGNAVNEKVISGNRHYRTPAIAMANLVAIVSSLNDDGFKNMLFKNNIHIPSVEETMECITRSTKLYWHSRKHTTQLSDFVNKLNATERAAIVYIGDLYHFREHNKELMFKMIDKLSTKVESVEKTDHSVIHTFPEAVVNMAHIVCAKELAGHAKNYDKMPDNTIATLAATCRNVVSVLEEHKDIIVEVLLPTILPVSVAYFPLSLRRCVLVSDTDSTMFATDEWVKWFFGKFEFSDKGFAIAASVMLLSTESIAHNLRMLSANIGAAKNQMTGLAMKPEFSFVVFAGTSIGKHYFSRKAVQEGNVFPVPEIEIKGVHLKNSAMPPLLVSKAKEMMELILETVYTNKQMTGAFYMKYIADIEREIKRSLDNNEPTYLKSGKVKDASAYATSEETSPYSRHIMWLDVFADKYGAIEPPPYSTVKIPTTLTTAKKTKDWLLAMEDRELSFKMTNWMNKYNKKQIPTFYVEATHMYSNGLPKEMAEVMDYRKIILDMTKIFKIIGEACGLFIKTDKLLSEMGY
jgi:hypothetical protein